MARKSVLEVDAKALRRIADGGAVLGAGGGGNPYIGRLMAEQALGPGKTVPVVPLSEFADDELILPIAMMGAPAVMQEKFPSGQEIPSLVAMMERLLGRKVSAILCIEAGGLNSTIPFAAAAYMNLPIVDADGMGRAFPELQMVTHTLGGIKATPMAMFDDKGNGATFDTVSNKWTERLARALTIEMGGSAMVGLYAATAGQLRDCLIHGSMSMIYRIGGLMEEHGANAARVLAETYGGAVLFQGRVRDVERRNDGGFTRGTVAIEGTGDFRRREVKLSFQNEFIGAEEDGRLLATVPDLITLLDSNTGEPVTTEMIKYGLAVNVLGLPCAPIWRTPAALDLVGPRYFGLDVDYRPLTP